MAFVLGFMWIPFLPLFIHRWYIQNYKQRCEESYIVSFIKWSFFLLFFPLVPSLRNIKTLFIKRKFKSSQKRMQYLKYEHETNEIKSISGAIESPLQLILMIYMMLRRGLLKLPWNESLSSSCVEDSLGRIACLPSIPTLSMVFSVLSIIKSIYDLNLYPVVSADINSLTKYKILLSEVLISFPYYLANVMFRIISYVYIIIYIDFWAFIPGTILYILNAAILVIKQPISGNNFENNTGAGELQSENPISDKEYPDKKTLIWDGKEWISKSIEDLKDFEENNPEDISVTTDETAMENHIYSPVFINSIVAYFLPAV